MLRLSFYITTLVFGFILSIKFFPLEFEFLDPLNQALEDFQITDLIFKEFKEEQQDTHIVFVNIGFLNRVEIAQQIENIAKFHPKVIGIDALFAQPRDSEWDSALSRVLQKYGQNIVMVNAFEQYNPDKGKADSISQSMKYFSDYVHQGYSNLDDRSLLTVRNYRPFTVVRDSLLPAFSTQIVKLYAPEKWEILKNRNQEFETINYRGNFDKYYAVIEAEDALNSTLDFSFVKNKIVLFGYLNSQKDAIDITDKFFTPLNTKMAGRSLPDMYGIVIHGNIISMVLSQDYIESMSWLTSVVIAIIVCFMNILFLLYIYFKKNHLYDIITRVMQLSESLFLYYVIIWLFDSYRYETDLLLTFIVIAIAPDILEFFMHFYEKWNDKKI